jgi:hypothetical protein
MRSWLIIFLEVENINEFINKLEIQMIRCINVNDLFNCVVLIFRGICIKYLMSYLRALSVS